MHAAIEQITKTEYSRGLSSSRTRLDAEAGYFIVHKENICVIMKSYLSYIQIKASKCLQ
ncbi:hypothetical protein GCM10011396_03480 [Undibacterium terreum]|uniref:Uncharacterized protein n=1 Tax=Undibacterium terreum TaxID=1224302 RepID=A0A916U4V9_9BURK|nr:hypothetical protein GCM10011396_03480 [Undibacterium terreum]